jgi:hypothetical protein
VLEPSGVEPSRKLTDPVGVPADEDTVADNVNALCKNVGMVPQASRTAVAAWFTTMLFVTCVAAVKLVLPVWFAATTTVPAPVMVSVLPVILPGPETMLKVTGLPEPPPVALRVIGATP